MTPNTRRAPRRWPPPDSKLATLWQLPLILIVSCLAWMAASLMAWPVIVGMQHLTDCCFIPHARGTYVTLSGMAKVGLLDYPTDYRAFGVMFLNMPIGFIAIFWWILFLSFAADTRGRWKKLPRRDRVLRAQRQHELLRRFGTIVAICTLFALMLCVPFIRQYEIVTDRAILLKHFFDWDEQVYPLAQLTRIHRSVSAKGMIFWDFHFSDGRSFTMSGPSREALIILLNQPKVRANARIVGDRLMTTPEP